MQKKYQIMPAKKEEFSLIVDKLDRFFGFESGYFKNLVLTLYKDGINTYEDHLVVKDSDEIIGIVAAQKKKLLIDEKEYIGMLIGSLSVDPRYRNQGIMTMILNYLDETYRKEVDFFALSGNYDRYHRFGFDYSAEIYQYKYFSTNQNASYSFRKVSDYDKEFCHKLHYQSNYKVERRNIIDNLYMWKYQAYLILKDGYPFGYFVLNPTSDIVEEIIVLNENEINDVLNSVSYYLKKSISIKIAPTNYHIERLLSSNFKEEYTERNLYKIINEELKTVYIPRCDLI